MKKNKLIILFLGLIGFNACDSNKGNPKHFYQNFNFVTLKPLGIGKDTLTQVPYVKIDTLPNQFLRVCLVEKGQEKTFIYEKDGEGWLNRDTCCEAQGYDFTFYDGSTAVSYSYRTSDLQPNAFHLVNITIEQPNYEVKSYLFGLYNPHKIDSACSFKMDTSHYQFSIHKQRLIRADTICEVTSYYNVKTQTVKKDTFYFFKKVPFEFFHPHPYEPFFEQIVK